MPELNAAIKDIPMPVRLARRPLTSRGFPVPWFASQINGEWNLVAIDPRKIVEALSKKLCWVCGGPLGRYMAFVIGPMCTVNRVSAEPPVHRECAEYTVRACPFLANPRMRRNEVEAATLGSGPETTPGIMLQHNPGAQAIWITKSAKVERHGNGVLFFLGEPTEVLWYARGAPATRADILASFDIGLPKLRAVAEAEGAGKEMEAQWAKAMRLVPA
jgi:hypothetical protein